MTGTFRKAMAAVFCLAIGGAGVGCGQGGKASSKQAPNVLVILVDALRKDRLHLYGYERRTSDNLDALAGEGWVFENHIAQASQTVPSTLSLMLGRYPAEHGFAHRKPRQFVTSRPVYPDEFLFLAEVFREKGYVTAGFVANPYLGLRNAFNQGFETFVHFKKNSIREAEMIAVRAIAWLRTRAVGSGRPFFLYLHFMDVHQPYVHPAAYMRRFPLPEGSRLLKHNGLVSQPDPQDFEYTSTAYDAGIPWVDDQMARIIGTLDELGARDDTIIAVTSDHGDEFLEHGGLGHGTTVYGELVRIPLIIVYRRKLEPGKRITHLTQHVDLGGTLLELAGIARVDRFKGRNLLHEPAPRAYAENGPWRTVYAEGKKLILNTSNGEAALFHASDELDEKPIEDSAAVERLKRHLRWYLEMERSNEDLSAGGEIGENRWSEEELERLRALGYVQ